MRRSLRHLLTACLTACLAAAVQAQVPQPVDVDEDTGRVSAWKGLRVLETTDPTLSVDQAAALMTDGPATTVDSPVRVFGRAQEPHWTMLTLRNTTASALFRLLVLEATTQFDIRVYRREPTGRWQAVKSQADLAAGRIGGGSVYPVWAVQLAPNETVHLLARTEGPSVLRFPLYLYHPAAYVEGERTTHLIMGLTVGICLFIGVYVGWLRRHLNDPSVPLFLYMLAGDLLGALWISGFLSELFPAVPEHVRSQIGFAAYAVLFGAASLHARIYLDLATWAPRTDRLLRAIGWFCLALAPWFSLVFPVGARLFIVWGGAVLTLLLVHVYAKAARRKISLSWLIVAAWIASLFISSTFLIARLSGGTVVWSHHRLALLQATLIAVCFGLAMIQRLMVQRDTLARERREAVMQKEQSAALMRQRSLLFSATSHDLRQPLSSVGLLVDLLKSARAPAEQAAHARKLDQALQEVDNLLVGIQQLASAHETSRLPPLESVSLDALLAPLVEEYRERSRNRHLSIRYVPSRLSIATHPPFLLRIVRNLLSNAVRYTEPGNRILIGCRRGGGLRLVIADTGRGMSAEQIKHAFDPFQRFDTEAPIPDGFGLGLFSAKALADALGMKITVRSEPGRGTVFSIYFPQSPPDTDGK